MWRKRSSPGLTEHLLQVEILLRHVWKIHRLILQRHTRHRRTSRHKTRRITPLTPLGNRILTPVDSGVVPSKPGVTQYHRGQRWVNDKKCSSLRVVARCDEGERCRGMGDVRKWLSIECTDRNLVVERGGGDLELVNECCGLKNSPPPQNPATQSRRSYLPPIAVLPGGEWHWRIGLRLPHPTITSVLLPGLPFYRTLHPEVSRRATVHTQSSPSPAFSLLPGKPNSTDLHGFVVRPVADRTFRLGGKIILGIGYPLTISLVMLL